MEPTLVGLSRRRLLQTGATALGVAGLAVALPAGSAAAADAYDRQRDWRWCNYCQCLFYEKDYTSGCCVKKCGHNWRGSGNYYVGHGTPPKDHQPDWKWCHECEN